MNLEATFKRLGILLLALSPAASGQAGTQLDFQLAQTGGNERIPGGVERAPPIGDAGSANSRALIAPQSTSPAAEPAIPPTPILPAPDIAPLPAPPQMPSDTEMNSHTKQDQATPERQ